MSDDGRCGPWDESIELNDTGVTSRSFWLSLAISLYFMLFVLVTCSRTSGYTSLAKWYLMSHTSLDLLANSPLRADDSLTVRIQVTTLIMSHLLRCGKFTIDAVRGDARRTAEYEAL